jgi:hypothetical protein
MTSSRSFHGRQTPVLRRRDLNNWLVCFVVQGGLRARHPLRSCLNNAPPRGQQPWRVQPDQGLCWQQDSRICYPFAHMGGGYGRSYIQRPDRWHWEEQARRVGLHNFWVDTCCIDKSNNNELAEAINSMFRWYCNATKCYVYLPDVSSPGITSSLRPQIYHTTTVRC